jgi:hypothetical protein
MVTETAAQVWDLAKFTCSAQQCASAGTDRGWQNRRVPTPAGVPVAASSALRELITGPAVPAVVRGVFPTALYVDVGTDLVAVVSRDGLRLPCALVVTEPSAARPLARFSIGDAATMGDGVVSVGDRSFVVRRWWRPRRALPWHPGPQLTARCAAVEALLPPLPHPLPADPGAWSPASMVGLGPGLTPAGDDVLAGMLLTLCAAPAAAPRWEELATETLSLLSRTTSLSATLLQHAAAGRGIPQVLDVVDALAGTGNLPAATARLLAVGHSSGAALAHGVLVAARLVAEDSTRVAKVA